MSVAEILATNGVTEHKGLGPTSSADTALTNIDRRFVIASSHLLDKETAKYGKTTTTKIIYH